MQNKEKTGQSSHSDVLYRKLIEHMNEGVWVGDKNECTVYANPKFCQMVNYKLEEIIGKVSYDFWDKESANRVKNVNQSERKKGISSSYEGNLLTKNGKLIPVLLSGTPLPDGGTIGIITDLSEMKQKENMEKNLTSAINYANDAIMIFGKDGKITTWNRGAKIIFGFKEEEIINSRIDKIFSTEKILEILKNSKIVHNIDLLGVHKNKSKINISATISPINNNSKKNYSYLLIARDITTNTKFEEELALKYEKIKEAYNKLGILRRQSDYIFDLMDLASAVKDKKRLSDYIVSSIIMLTKVDACILRSFDPKRRTLELLSFFGVGKEWRGKSHLKYSGSLLEKAFTNKRPLKIIDVTKEPKYQSVLLAKKNNLCSLLLIPLTFKSKLIGSLSLYTTPEKKLEIFENEFIENYAKLIELALTSTEY